MPSNASRKILIVAAEASSCLYAQRLLEYWKNHDVQVEAFGIGNEAMASQGFECLARAEDLAVVGIQEVVSHWGMIKKAFHDVLEAATSRQPDVVLLLDYPGFNLRLAKKIKALKMPVVYYISPQIWAWKTGRIKQIQKFVDKMLVVFPFEKDFYDAHGVEVEFVGHPLLDELALQFSDPRDRAFRRARFGIGPNDLVLGLMPGSRNSELKHHLRVQLETASRMHQRHPNLKVALFVAPNFSKEDVQAQLPDLNLPLMLIKAEPFAMIDLADVILCASGTATLMVGLLEKPMVIMYRMNPMTAMLAKAFVNKTKYFGLINLVLDAKVAPELFQGEAGAEQLSAHLDVLIASPSERSAMANALRAAKERLGQRGATEKVAHAIAEYWSK